MIALKNILVPTDFSDTSANAVRYAKAFAETFQASLHLLHVVEELLVYAWTPPEGSIPLAADIRADMEARTREQLQKVDRKSTRLNSSHSQISYAVFCLKKKK